MTDFEPGSIYKFSYLWGREKARGEESGRKFRPVCLVIRSIARPGDLYLFPITTKSPRSNTRSLSINTAECRFSGLSHPSWIILDEFNLVAPAKNYDFGSLEPTGRFTKSFLDRVIKEAAALARAQQVTRVSRD